MALPNMPLQRAIPPQGDRVESRRRLGAGFQLNGKALDGLDFPSGSTNCLARRNECSRTTCGIELSVFFKAIDAGR